MPTTAYPIHPTANIFPMLSAPELRRLAADIKRNGLVHPILLYKGEVVDGRNRLTACATARITPHFKAIDPEIDQRGSSVLEYIVSLNLRRRQLNPSQQALAAAEALPEWTARGKIARQSYLRRGECLPVGKKVRERGRSDLQVAKLFGVSARYVRIAAELLKSHPSLAAQVKEGKLNLSRAWRHVRAAASQEEQAQELRRARKNIAEIEVRRLDMRNGSHYTGEQFNLIVTDPPYANADLELWDSLAKLAGKTLVRGGFLAALSGQQYLDKVLVALTRLEYGLQYLWTACLSFSGKHGRRFGLGIATSWRPIVIFYKPPFIKPRWQLVDLFKTSLPPLQRHKWEQLPKAFVPLIKCLSKPDDRVLDPFAGSGAVLEACRSLGRHSVGWDIDADAVQRMEMRFGLPHRH